MKILRLSFCFLTALLFMPSALALENAGFEEGLSPWSITGSANEIVVVESDSPEEFEIYAATGVVVTPISPTAMLRLGTPEVPGDQNNNQNDGDTGVTQTFEATSSSLTLAVRIFSTEFRRNRDSVTIGLSGVGATLSGIDGCSGNPCEILLDAGRNGDFFNPGWDTFTLGGMTPGQSYTLSYTLTTAGGSSQPSWVYFDSVNLPPIADAGEDQEVFAGDTVTLDGSGSSDPEDDPLTYQWTLLDVPTDSTATLDDETAVSPTFTPDLLGQYTVQLIVDDGELASEPDTVVITALNRPPVAAFSCNPGGINGTVALEGDFIACDASDSSDPDGDEIVSYTWTVTGDALPAPIFLSGVVAGFYAPDDGFYNISLTISDGLDPDTVDSSDGSSGLVLAPSSVGNAPPLARALDVEVLAGGVATLRCRGVDPGADDPISASFSGLPGSGSLGPINQIVENDPAYATLAATIEFNTAPEGGSVSVGTHSAYCDVSDGLTSAMDTFTLDVLDPLVLYPAEGEQGRFEPNESSASAAELRAGRTKLARLESSGDVDFYEVRMADGSVPPVGTEILVRLKVPTDYDAVLLSRPIGDPDSTVFQSAPFVSFPFVSFPFVSFEQRTAPFVSFPFVSFPQQTAPFVSFPFVSFPFVSFPFETSPFVSFPFQVEDFPLSQMADAPSGIGSSGDAVGFGEIGSLNVNSFEDDNLRVKDLSANFNTPDTPFETLFGVKTADETGIYVAVVSYDGNVAPEPYELTLETSRPLDTEAYLNSSCDAAADSNCNCSGTPLVAPAAGFEEIRAGSSPSTLIVTQRQRLQAHEGLSDAEWNQFVTDITPWLTAVDARFISVDSALFDDWDSRPCDIDALDPLADALATVVKAELADSGITSVIILGDFDTFPSDSEVDFTQIGNEALFLRDLPVRPETPIATVFRAGHFLSDACLTDTDPIPFNGGLFCVEDVPTGRLASTARLVEQANAGNVIPYSTGLVTGYEFFLDVAGAMSNSLTNLGGSLAVLNNEVWSANNLDDPLNSLEPQWCVAPPDVSAVQGHASFNAFLSANGFNTGDFTDITTVDECPGDPNSLTASIGCHTLTFVPESATLPEEFFPADPALTWADRSGTMVGTYGFGLGHTDTDELGTEGILKRFFACIGGNADPEQPLMSVGQCLLNAKLEYLQSRTSIDAYDVKSVMTLALSGIPDVTVVPTAAESFALIGEPEALSHCTGEYLDLVVADGGGTAVTQHCVETVTTPQGTYLTVDGQYQAGTGRPLLPTLQVSSGPVAPNPTAARSMSLKGGTYDLQLGIDPVIGNLETEWDEIEESKACGSMAPTEIGVINLLPVAGVLEETFNLTTAQFECTLAPADQNVEPTVGNQRKFNSLEVELNRPPLALAGDLDPPDVTQRDIIANATSGDAMAVVNATDENGIAMIQVNVYTEDRINGGPGDVESFACPGPNCEVNNLGDPSEPSQIFLPGAAGKFVAIEYYDNAWNKILKSGKGQLVEAVEVVIRTTTLNLGGSTLIRVEIERLDQFLSSGLTVTVDYGDGTTEEFFLDETALCDAELTTDCVTLLADGTTGLFETEHLFPALGDSFTISVTLRGAASGYDEAVLTRCEDDTGETLPDGDIASCAFNTQGTNVEIDLFVVGQIDDDTYKYRLQVFGEQFQYSRGRLSRPSGVQGTITLLGDNGLRFSFDAADLGWDGESSFTVEQSTQDGVKQGQSQGETDVNVFEASVGAPGI